VRVRREILQNTNNKPRSAFRMVKLLPLFGATYQRFSVRFVRKARLTREGEQLNEKCLQTTKSKPGSAYGMVKLLPLCGATQRRFPLPVHFRTLNAINSRTVRAKRKMFTELPIANQVRRIGWSSYFRLASPSVADFRF
jgi:hypothetical protein